MIQTVEWTDAGVVFIDQTKLPTEESYVTCKTYQEVATAIRDMIVRGAPAIGVSAAMGIALGVSQSQATSHEALLADFEEIAKHIGATRPTAVNLFWAIARMRNTLRLLKDSPVAEAKQALIEESRAMHREDIEACKALGLHGAAFMPDAGGVLTHCNAGA